MTKVQQILQPAKKGRATELDSIIGERIREIRSANGFTQEDIADHLGISKQQFQKYETGKNRISFSRMVELVRFVDASFNDIFKGLEHKAALGLGDIQAQQVLSHQSEAEQARQKETAELLKTYNSIQDSEARTNFVKAVKQMAKMLSN